MLIFPRAENEILFRPLDGEMVVYLVKNLGVWLPSLRLVICQVCSRFSILAVAVGAALGGAFLLHLF
jgi:hypothetical protein